MGHSNVVSGHLKSTRIPWVDGLSTGPPDLGRHKSRVIVSCLKWASHSPKLQTSTILGANEIGEQKSPLCCRHVLIQN